MKIAVGSKNKAKIRAVKMATQKIFGKFQIISTEVESGVNSQPKSDEESEAISKNRLLR